MTTPGSASNDFLKVIGVAAAIGIAALMIIVGRGWWIRSEWFSLQSEQLAAIEQLKGYPSAGWQQEAWNEAIITLSNVWGNVTYHPNYSGISNAEMRDLKRQLDHIVAETDSRTSINSVDLTYSLLLRRGQKIEFISGYHDEFTAESKSRQPKRTLQPATE